MQGPQPHTRKSAVPRPIAYVARIARWARRALPSASYVPDPPLAVVERVLWFLIAGSRGGHSRARILQALAERPSNPHPLLNPPLGIYRLMM